MIVTGNIEGKGERSKQRVALVSNLCKWMVEGRLVSKVKRLLRATMIGNCRELLPTGPEKIRLVKKRSIPLSNEKLHW